jgi:hypothetical protein
LQEYAHADTDDLSSHLTNYAQNVDADVWGLQQLREHLGSQRYEALLARIHQQ